MLRELATPGFERVVEIEDGATGLHAIVALHSTRLGPAFGGIRRRRYPTREAALSEVLGLAQAMSHKCALAGLPAGGAKTVILDADGVDAQAAYVALAQVVQDLDGAYVCGPDVGTSDTDLAYMRARCEHVNPAGNDAGASTAFGVLAAARATVLAGADGDSSQTWSPTRAEPFAGARVAIEGLGAVGGALARMMLAQGAEVFGADPDPQARERAAALGVEVFEDAAALDLLRVDLLMPCALGASVDAGRCDSQVAKMICGSANNQLSQPEHDRALYDAGVRWAPDILTSAGAVIEGVRTYLALRGTPTTRRTNVLAAARKQVREDLADIETRAAQIFARSQAQGRPPGRVALDIAQGRLSR